MMMRRLTSVTNASARMTLTGANSSINKRCLAPLRGFPLSSSLHHLSTPISSSLPINRQYSTDSKVPKELIKQIREETSAPLGQILKALKETNNNVEEAKKKLRELGVSIAAHKASRATKEGVCGFVKLADGDYVIFELNCETDFVARGEEFGKLIHSVQDQLTKNPNLTSEQLTEVSKDDMSALTLKVGENITIPRVERFKGDHVYVYLHNRAPNAPDTAQSFAIVELNKDDASLGTNLAMHICGMTPLYTSRENIPESDIAEERSSQLEIFKREQEKLADELKEPEDRYEKIMNRKIEKWMKEVCLVEQSYLLQPSKTVAQILKDKNAEVKQWKRVKVGLRN